MPFNASDSWFELTFCIVIIRSSVRVRVMMSEQFIMLHSRNSSNHRNNAFQPLNNGLIIFVIHVNALFDAEARDLRRDDMNESSLYDYNGLSMQIYLAPM